MGDLTNQSNWPVTKALNNFPGSQLVQWNVLIAAMFQAAVATLLGLTAGVLMG